MYRRKRWRRKRKRSSRNWSVWRSKLCESQMALLAVATSYCHSITSDGQKF